MLRKFAMVTTLAAAVLSSISGNTVQAEVLVPLQQYLNTTNRIVVQPKRVSKLCLKRAP